MIFWAIFQPFPIENSEEISIADRVVKIKKILEILVATNQDMILFKLLTFNGVLLTDACYCLQPLR